MTADHPPVYIWSKIKLDFGKTVGPAPVASFWPPRRISERIRQLWGDRKVVRRRLSHCQQLAPMSPETGDCSTILRQSQSVPHPSQSSELVWYGASLRKFIEQPSRSSFQCSFGNIHHSNCNLVGTGPSESQMPLLIRSWSRPSSIRGHGSS
jgi:hypothetical protein